MDTIAAINLFCEFCRSLKKRVERDLVPTYSYMGVECEHHEADPPRDPDERYVVHVRWRHQHRTDCIFHLTTDPYMLDRLDATSREGTVWLPIEVDREPLWEERLPCSKGRAERRMTSPELAKDLVARFKHQLDDDRHMIRGRRIPPDRAAQKRFSDRCGEKDD